MRVICPSRGPVTFERNVNLCSNTGISNNDNLCHNTAVPPKLATYSYPQYDDEVVCPPNRFRPPLKLPDEMIRFNKGFEKRRKVKFCCQPFLPPAYRPVFPVPPAEFWTHVDMCRPWHFFHREACCDRPRPYNWENDLCPIPYCRPGGKATPPYVLPYPNLGLYFPLVTSSGSSAEPEACAPYYNLSILRRGVCINLGILTVITLFVKVHGEIYIFTMRLMHINICGNI